RFASASLAGTGGHFRSASAPRDSGSKSASPDSGKEARTERKWKGWTPIAATGSSWTARWCTTGSRTKTDSTSTRRAERSVRLPTAAIRTASTRTVTLPIEELERPGTTCPIHLVTDDRSGPGKTTAEPTQVTHPGASSGRLTWVGPGAYAHPKSHFTYRGR